MEARDFKILIAEDEEINFLYIDILIKKEYPNMQVLHAKNGEEAVEFFKKNRGINLIVMDIKMPKMNGYEATDEIKKINQDIPVFALTAYSTEEDRKQAMKFGFQEFLTKPLNKKKLLSIIKDNITTAN